MPRAIKAETAWVVNPSSDEPTMPSAGDGFRWENTFRVDLVPPQCIRAERLVSQSIGREGVSVRKSPRPVSHRIVFVRRAGLFSFRLRGVVRARADRLP
jgi:hypothetical protein